MRDRRQHLRRAHVRTAEHSHFAVRIGKRRGPFHGVVSVVRLIHERVELSVRSISAADVLNDHHKSTLRAL